MVINQKQTSQKTNKISPKKNSKQRQINNKQYKNEDKI